MKKFLTLMLALHVLMEGGVGLLLAFSPTTLVPDVGGDSLAFLINYGCAGITMALVVAWLWPHRHDPVAMGMALGILATFHTAQAVAGILVLFTSGAGMDILISHGLFALGFWFLWSRRVALAQA